MLKAKSHTNWTCRHAHFQSSRSHISFSCSSLSPTTVISWHLFPSHPYPSALTLWLSGLRCRPPSSLQFTRQLRLLFHFPTEHSPPQRRVFVGWNISDMPIFLVVVMGILCLLISALPLHQSEQRHPRLLLRAFQAAAHEKPGEELYNTK